MSEKTALEPIAIIGMACIFPQAPDLQAFWNNILSGVDAVGEPVAEWDAQRYIESGRIKTAMGGWLKDLYRFDPREFGIMPHSVDGGEPDHFLALRVARDALADAGYHRSDADHRDTGIILGHSTYLHRGQVTVIQNNIVLDQTMALLQAALPNLDAGAAAALRQLLQAKLPPTNADTAPGLVPNVMTGRIANRLNLRGPNYLVDAACSSSLLAVSAAIDELRAGRSRLMLAGGVNASLSADVSTIFTQLGALSARGRVRPFEAGSDGTLLGEGLGVVVLKRLSDALADGDRIYASVRGIGQSSDGRGTGLLAPSVEGETLAIRRAYDTTGVEPSSVGLIEAHGTGIPLGDRTEINALKNVFGERQPGSAGSIAVGSVKSMISHCIPAAGVAGLIKSALALHHRVLPPTLCDSVNPELGIDGTRLFINTEAKPWIAPLGQPRRAGVDSFGFGGINTHAIVEQAPASAQRPALLAHWPFEMCVLSAHSVEALATAVEALLAALQRNPGWQLDQIAAALVAADRGAPVRLALVVKSREALAKALAGAVPKLTDGKGATGWTTRAGASFSSQPQGGKLAFIFPGEGSQYLNMFADLALSFDEVREWLDFWRGLYAEKPGQTRTDIAYPPATELTPARRKQLEARLHEMDVGSEAVMVGGQAMFALLGAFGVTADVMLGHSSGESSALAASGALPAHDLPRLAEFIRQLNAIYQRVLAAGKIPTGALLAVGALPAQMVHDAVAESGQHIDVAMDNCANQLVLYGQRAAIDDVQARLVSIGGICMPLPFDRGYHTPDFAEASAAFLDYYQAIELGVPQRPLYSCATTRLFASSAEAVRETAAAQWSTTVRFRETVQNMFDDGVRCFVEVGPSGNLSAFVGDVLADQAHLALATNARRRHGLEQFLSTLAQLWVHGRPLTLQALFKRRQIAVIDLAVDQTAPRLPGLIDNTLPTLRFDVADRAAILRLVSGPAATVAATHVAAAAQPVAEKQPAADTPEAEVPTNPVDPAAQVLAEYFDVMRGFLAQQQQVLTHWQTLKRAEAAGAEPLVAEAAPANVVTFAPFLDVVLAHDRHHLRAECHLSVHRDAFLRDHVLSGRGSDTDPDLIGLACVPLMVSLEIMAEACAVLAGGMGLRLIENVRASAWITLDDEQGVLDVTAEAIPGQNGRYRATLHQQGALAVSAEFDFNAAPVLPAVDALGAVSAPRWDGAEIYGIGMFHGPVFQSLQHIRGVSGEGLDCELTPCSLDGFFRDGDAAPLMVLNPVLLDAMGQLAACWIAEQVGTDFNCFPSTIARIELFDGHAVAAPGIVLRGRQKAVDSTQAHDIASARSWSFEAIDATGAPLVRVAGLVNVFFAVPHRFYQVRRDPLGAWLGAPLSTRFDSLLWQVEHFPEEFCAQSDAIFIRILAFATLSFVERDAWRALEKNNRRRRQWLMGRLALKEIVRHWLYEQTGHLLYPSDIVVGHDENGKPSVGGWWEETISAAPQVSLTHDPGSSIAVLSPGSEPVGVDAERIGRVQKPDLLGAAFTAGERNWLHDVTPLPREEAILRLWCAKEAAAKFGGNGLRGAPEAFEVTFESGVGENANVRYDNQSVLVKIQRSGNLIVAVAEDHVVPAKVFG